MSYPSFTPCPTPYLFSSAFFASARACPTQSAIKFLGEFPPAAPIPAGLVRQLFDQRQYPAQSKQEYKRQRACGRSDQARALPRSAFHLSSPSCTVANSLLPPESPVVSLQFQLFARPLLLLIKAITMPHLFDHHHLPFQKKLHTIVAGADAKMSCQFSAQRFCAAYMRPFLQPPDYVQQTQPDRARQLIHLSFGVAREFHLRHSMTFYVITYRSAISWVFCTIERQMVLHS